MGNVIMLYVPCKDVDEAKGIARQLVEKKLVACANILPGCTSIYEWQGKLCEESEAILIMKTINSLHMEVEKAITDLHSYDCPGIVALNSDEVNLPFAQWIEKSVSN
ncbi:MAG: divalent-cation tolerance protein CutA [Lentisphaeraceae bacterium]|nr:divalent-cation tolerance protein CutA [Lentisphaeraceae bacterium]